MSYYNVSMDQDDIEIVKRGYTLKMSGPVYSLLRSTATLYGLVPAKLIVEILHEYLPVKAAKRVQELKAIKSKVDDRG